MPREPEPSDQTCPFCGRADDPSAMIVIEIEARAFAWPATQTICLECATACYEAITRKLDSLTESGAIHEPSYPDDAIDGAAVDNLADPSVDRAEPGEAGGLGAGGHSDEPSEAGANGKSADASQGTSEG